MIVAKSWGFSSNYASAFLLPLHASLFHQSSLTRRGLGWLLLFLYEAQNNADLMLTEKAKPNYTQVTSLIERLTNSTSMFQVKPMCPSDYLYAAELTNTMGWNMTNEDFAFNCSLEPEGCFVLYEDSNRVGIATCVGYVKTGWFGNLIVNPDNRRKGAGGFLVRHAVNYLHNKGIETVGLYAYPNLTGFYNEIGFVADEYYSVLHARSIPKIVGGQVSEISHSHLEAIARFDQDYFGGDRKRFLYSIIKGEGNFGFFVAEETGMQGYVLVKVYGSLAEVGPLVCVPDRVDVAVKLLKSALGKLADFDVYLCLQKNQTTLQKYLYSVGFREEFYLTRMFLSPKLSKNCIYIAESKERG